MSVIQGENPAGQQQNKPLDEVVTIIKHNKVTIDHAIYIKTLSALTVSHLMVSTYDVLSTTNNETEFTELTRVFEEDFDIKVQLLSVLKYLNSRISQCHLGFSVNQTRNTMEIVNEWFTNVKLRKVDTPFITYYTYEKDIMDYLLLTSTSFA